MQILFITQQSPYDYASKGGAGKYPDAPKKCPYKSCGQKKELSKNGYYRRYLIAIVFQGVIRIRRYKCLKCGHTVSMLPSFCLACYTYGVEIIILLMREAIQAESIRKAAKKYDDVENVSRRQIKQYLSRLRSNKVLIQYGYIQISPEGASVFSPSGDTEWTKRLLLGNKPTLCPELSAKFHNAVGKSFMSTDSRIA